MKKSLLVLILFGLSVSVVAEGDVRLNSVEAESECRKQIEEVFGSDVQIKFKARPASSYGGGAYKFWINATEYTTEGHKSRGYLCEITRGGQLKELMQRDKRWRG